MTPIVGIRRGTRRLTLCVGAWAVKFARNSNGRRCNRFEADLWARTTPTRRNMLCPVLARLPFGLAIVMQRAQPLSKDEVERLKAEHGFPDWDYMPPDDEGHPLEHKPSDWGRLPDVDSLRWIIRRQRLNDGDANSAALPLAWPLARSAGALGSE